MSRFARFLPWLLALLLAVPFLLPKRGTVDGPDPDRLGRLPVLDGGRLKPFETVARATLLRSRGRASALDDEGKRLAATAWLADLLLNPAGTVNHRVHRVDDPDLLSFLGSGNVSVAQLSIADLRPHLAALDSQFQQFPEDASAQTRFQRALTRLRRGLLEVQRIEDSLLPPPPPGASLHAKLTASGRSSEPENVEDLFLMRLAERMVSAQAPLAIPRPAPDNQPLSWQDAHWVAAGEVILESLRGGTPDPLILAYAQLGDAWRAGNRADFNAAADAVEAILAERVPDALGRAKAEALFQKHSPFAFGLQLYVLAFLAAAASWALPRVAPELRSAAWGILLVAWLIHGGGIVARVLFSGYAPVTNLYSSAVFVGWAAVALALPFERRHGQGLITAVAGLAGFSALVIAHQLAILGGGDTLEMMSAVLDSNFWLSTHVITITLGYSATFLAGFIGIAGLLISLVRRRQPDEALANLVFGITAFSLLFSFVGTVLGGIWADQSWGRFWGWDPKENGALLVVVWNALLIHVRAGRMAGPRGILQIAVAGNIITAWSWFGTNMLGVGLHAYGFMDKAFPALLIFWGLNLAIILAAMLQPNSVPSRAASAQTER